MKNIILITFFMCAVFLENIVGQHISAEAYNKEVLHEDFNQVGDIFKIVTTTDNYFILDNGDYLLSRNNSESEYAIIAKNSSVNDFVLKTAIRIGPSNNKRASVGIILKAQQDGKGAIIFEINKKGQYRIKQLQGNTYSTLSGNKKNNGWIKSKIVNGVDEHNFVEIRSENNIYDVYINNNYLTSFFIPNYTTGSCGLIISSATKARISYYYIHSKGESTIVASYIDENTLDQNKLVEELNKKIKILEKNNVQLNKLNSKVRGNQDKEINDLSVAATNLEKKIKVKEEEIKALNNTINELKNNNFQFEEKLKNVEKLEKQYNIILQQINGLTSELEEEKIKNETLQNSQIDLRIKNTALTSKTKQQEEEIKTLLSSNSKLKNSNTASNTESQQLNKEITLIKQQLSAEQTINKDISALKAKIDILEKVKSNLSAELSLEVKQHTKTKDMLSKSVTKKAAEIRELETLLTKKNKKLSTLIETQEKHNSVTRKLKNDNTTLNATIDNLNSELTSLKENISELKTKNTELKDLFILKDFEVNDVNPSELTKITTTYPSPEELVGNEKIYAIQFGVYMTIQPYTALKGLDQVWYETTEYGTYIYLSGQFKSPQEATAHKNILVSLGYPNAFVVTLTK